MFKNSRGSIKLFSFQMRLKNFSVNSNVPLSTIATGDLKTLVETVPLPLHSLQSLPSTN